MGEQVAILSYHQAKNLFKLIKKSLLGNIYIFMEVLATFVKPLVKTYGDTKFLMLQLQCLQKVDGLTQVTIGNNFRKIHHMVQEKDGNQILFLTKEKKINTTIEWRTTFIFLVEFEL
jgi:hypothetical protein